MSRVHGAALDVVFGRSIHGDELEHQATAYAPPRSNCLVPGTILERNLFHKIGGYDVGMITYGAAEPEFSLRAWLSGAEIISVPELELRHRFQKQVDATRFLNRHRSILMHNNIRFGLLYLSRASSLQMLRHYAMKFPRNMRKALKLIEAGDVWERRASLQKNLVHDFAWFINKFDLTDQIGLPIL